MAVMLDRTRSEDLVEAPPRPYPRSDSPLAVVGEDRVEVNVKGLGRFRVRLNRAVPEGAVTREVVLTKRPGRDIPVEVRLVLAMPRAEPAFDPLETGRPRRDSNPRPPV